jgi:hypothetical protein
MRIIRIILFAIVSFQAVAQQPLRYRIYGGANQDEAEDFVETHDKGFLICGSSSSFGQGASSVYVIKTDSNGIFKWGQTYGWINSDRGMSIQNTPDHGAFISGFSNSFNNFDYDAYVVRIDSDGVFQWQRTYGGNDWDFLYASYPTPDSGLVLVGETYSDTQGDADAYMIRINKSGDVVWSRKLGTAYHERFNSVTIMENSIYACGKITDPATMTSAMLIARYSPDGMFIDSSMIHPVPGRNYELSSITNASYSDLLLSGGLVDPGAPAGAQQAEIRMRIDTNLTVMWLESPANLGATKVCRHTFEDNRGHMMCTYTVNGGNGKTAMFLADFNAGNGYVYGQTYGGLEEEEGVKGMITSRNTLAFLGNTYSWGHGDQDYWLVLFKADTLISDAGMPSSAFYYHMDTIYLSPIGLKEIASSETKLFPNPVSNNGVLTIIHDPSTANFSSIELLDIQGRKLGAVAIDNAEEFYFDLRDLTLATGMYIVRLKGDEAVQTIKISVQD